MGYPTINAYLTQPTSPVQKKWAAANDAALEKVIEQAEQALEAQHKEVAQQVSGLQQGQKASSAASFMQQSIVGDESPPSYPTINAYLTQPTSPVQKKWAAANDAALEKVIEQAE